MYVCSKKITIFQLVCFKTRGLALPSPANNALDWLRGRRSRFMAFPPSPAMIGCGGIWAHTYSNGVYYVDMYSGYYVVEFW